MKQKTPAAAEPAATPGRIVGTEFVLVDGRGRERATLAMEHGEPTLKLWNKRNSSYLSLGMVDEGPYVTLSDGENIRAMLFLGDEGEPSLHLSDSTGRTRVEFEVDVDDTPIVSLYDREGDVGITMAVLNTKDEPNSILHLVDHRGRLNLITPDGKGVKAPC